MIFCLSRSFRQCSVSQLIARAMSTRVKVDQGVVRGCEDKLPDGRTYFRYSGIPYAKPPVNELRFRSPQKLLKFEEDEIDCTKERDPCFHKSPLLRRYVGSEDCLNLNVYVPKQDDPNKKFTVMVFIHGGGFKYDSNTKLLYSPEYLLMEDVLVITINYRQHVLGFLNIPNKGIPGNAGLKDQQMALQWVHENISNFNGDHNNICLFGESGGAASAHFQLMNPKSRKYISSIICQSGSIVNDWAFYGQTEETVRSLARLLGCQKDAITIDDAYTTLMNASTKDLYDNCDGVITAEDTKVAIRNKWRMVVEEESDDAFITQRPYDSMLSQAGKINIPMLSGSNNGDGLIVAASIRSRKRLGIVNDNFTFMIPRSLTIADFDEAKEFAKLMKEFYLGGRDLNEETLKEFVTLRTDVDYLIAQTITNELTARYMPGCKQYLNEFQFDGKLNLQKKQMRLEHLPFAAHADDLFYIFGGTLADKVELTEDSREWKMRKLMCKLWTNFAKYHDPTPDHDNPLPFKWSHVEPVVDNTKEIDLDYLVIDDQPKMVRNLNKDRMDFWRNAYRKLNKDYMKAKL